MSISVPSRVAAVDTSWVTSKYGPGRSAGTGTKVPNRSARSALRIAADRPSPSQPSSPTMRVIARSNQRGTYEGETHASQELVEDGADPRDHRVGPLPRPVRR